MKSIESTEDFSAALRIVVGGAYVDGLNARPHSTEAVKCTVRLLRETDATLRSEVAALREALQRIEAAPRDPAWNESGGWEMASLFVTIARSALTRNGGKP